MTASPDPSSNPSITLAATPRRSSVKMVGLEPHGKSAGQTDRVSKTRHDLSFGGDGHEVLKTAELTHRCDHFWRQPRCDRDENLARRRV